MFTVFGIAYSFGAFFGPMAREFHSGAGATAAVFSITAFLYFGLGALSGWLADRIGPRRVVFAGAVVMGGGLLLTAIVPNIQLGYLTYGLGVGIGTTCGYVPMVGAAGGWFHARRGLAIGIAVSGIGLGTLFVPPLAAALISAHGWRTTYAIFGVASFLILTACAAAAFRPAGLPPAGSLALGRAVRTREFGLMYLSAVFLSFSLFIFFVHLVPYAEAGGVDVVRATGLIAVIGAGSFLGRIILGWLAGRAGSVRTFQGAVLLMAASYLIWLLQPGYEGLATFAFLMGFGYGGWVALSPAVAADLFGAEGLGGTVGALYTSAAIGALVGPPAAGFVKDAMGTYQPAIAAAMVLAVVSLFVILPLRRSAKVVE